MAKSRLAPIKTLTMPRLELNAAVIGVKLFNLISHETDLPIEKVKFWSGTMQYIQDQSQRFKIYLANRISPILERISSNYGKFKEGVKNAADLCPSEVLQQTQLLETDKHGRNWFSVPEFLYDNKKMWYTQRIETLDETNPEIRKAETFLAINVTKENLLIEIQYGSWSKTIRVIGWVLTIYFNLKARNGKGRTGMEP